MKNCENERLASDNSEFSREACEHCGYSCKIGINITIKDAIKELTLCPNCMAVAFLNNELDFVNNPELVDAVTGKNGAVEFISYDEHYVLEKEAMMRLISHNLKPNEYFALAEKYGAHKYMIHDDFYTEDGIAWQPMGKDWDEEKYDEV